MQAFFCNFIRDFVPGCSAEGLQKWSAQFIRESRTWGWWRVSIDKQFLAHQISAFRAHCLSDQVLGPNVPCRVPHEKWDAFARCLCDSHVARAFLSARMIQESRVEMEWPVEGEKRLETSVLAMAELSSTNVIRAVSAPTGACCMRFAPMRSYTTAPRVDGTSCGMDARSPQQSHCDHRREVRPG